jgi:putative transposase
MMKNDYQWRTGRYCVFKNFVHLVFTTKYRKGVFTKEMLEIMEVAVKDSCKKMGGELLEFGGEGDHVHLFVSLSPKVALCHFVGRLKGASSYVIRKRFGSKIKEKLWGKHLWSPSYCAVSCGGASLDVIKEYVKNQRAPSSDRGVKQSIRERGRTGDWSRVRIGKIRRA